MPHTKKQKKKDINNFILSLLTLFGIGALTVGCGASKIDESFIAENQKLKSELNKLKAEKEKLKQEKKRFEVSERGKQECLKRSDLGKNAFTAKQIYNECLETIDASLARKDAYEADLYYERQRKEEAQKKKKLAEAKLNNKDENDCKEGSIIGGILGAGLTMSSTKGKDRWWAVPLGATAGSLVGCQIDGG